MKSKSEDGTRKFSFDLLSKKLKEITGLSSSSTDDWGTTLTIPDTTVMPMMEIGPITATRVVSRDVLTLEKFLNRYRVEPRGNNTGVKWMVIYDKKKGDYVKDTDSVSGKAYLKFKDTDEMFEFFKENNKL